MAEIASREFMDNLVSILKAYGAAATDNSVKEKILELIQAWAMAAEGRPALLYINEVYTSLQRERYHFPPKPDVTSSMFDSSAPPEWADSDVCMRCRTPFTFTNRKHHCRNCGNVFCGACSSKSIPLPHLGIMQAVRVDDGCYQKLTDKAAGINRGTPVPQGFDAKNPARTLYQGSRQPRSATNNDNFDDDLKRALELSLKESQGSAGQGYVPQSQLKSQTSKPVVTNGSSNSTSKPLPKPSEEDEDPELKAAIEASLRDMEEQKKKHAATFKQTQSSDGYTAPPRSREYELTPAEAENINLFSTLVERLQHQPPGTILREPQIQELYESIGKLRPKLARTYGETMSKHDTLLDLHSKLASVVRYYDRMLEERMNRTYGQGFGGYNLPSTLRQPMQNPYPSFAPPGGGVDRAGIEGYYNSGDAPDFARPQSTYGFASAPTPQAQYANYDQRASYIPNQPTGPDPGYAQQPPQQYPNAQQQPSNPYAGMPQQQGPPQLQRQSSLQQYPTQQTFSPVQAQQHPEAQPVPQTQYSQTPSAPPADPAMAYYLPEQQHPSEQQMQLPPNVQYQHPVSPPSQPEPHPYQQQIPPQQQYYPSQTPAQPPGVVQQLHQMPAAPTSAPVFQAPQPKIEEALIEL